MAVHYRPHAAKPCSRILITSAQGDWARVFKAIPGSISLQPPHVLGTRIVIHAMDTCEPGQALIGAALSSAGYVPWASRSEFPEHGDFSEFPDLGDSLRTPAGFPNEAARARMPHSGPATRSHDFGTSFVTRRHSVVYNPLFASLDADA